MSNSKFRFIAKDSGTKRLDEVLAEWLPKALGRPVSKAKGRKLVMAGAVHLNGRRVRSAAEPIPPGAVIEATVDVARLFEDSTSRDRTFELTEDRVLFEDEDLIVVDKPAGLPTHPTIDVSRDNLVAALRRFLMRKTSQEDPYIGIHHRLDRDTSGIVLFTRSRQVNAAVAEIFSAHQGIKLYQALTHPRNASATARKSRNQWVTRNYLGKVSAKSKQTRYGAVNSDGEFAETAFRMIAEYPRGCWVEAMPKTGRTHQIRVHLSGNGLPVLGDDLYKPNENSRNRGPAAPRLMLHAAQLIFPHPITKREVSIKSPLPRDFQQCLSELQSQTFSKKV